MKLTFLGANRNVTGSRTCLEANGRRVLIDCGLTQEREHVARNWDPCPVPAESVDALLVTHAHVDHIGLIPRFVGEGFRGTIWATHPSVALADLMLKDSARIQVEDAKYKRRRHRKERREGPRPVVPLYDEQDAERALERFHGVDYGEPVEVAPGMTATWHDAGHILGSASLTVEVKEGERTRTFLFSGDVGQSDLPLTHDPTRFALTDYVVLESTYGNREHEDHGNIEAELERIIRRTAGRGGNVVIPVFAVERAQKMMFFVSRLVHNDRIPDIPVFLDSPLAYDVTDVFRKFTGWLDDETRQLIASDQPPLRFPGLRLTRTPTESKGINRIPTPCIIMAPAGMCNAGRIKHHLRLNVERHQSTIVFVGFQARGTLGRQLVEGAREVRIHGRRHWVRADIEQVSGLSAHADRTELLAWLEALRVPPRRLFLNHGEEEAAQAFRADVEERFGFDVSVPAYGEEVVLEDHGPSRAGEP
jgi:metallo-beta-lactamase family protein